MELPKKTKNNETKGSHLLVCIPHILQLVKTTYQYRVTFGTLRYQSPMSLWDILLFVRLLRKVTFQF